MWDASEGTVGLIPCHYHHPSLVSIPCIFKNKMFGRVEYSNSEAENLPKVTKQERCRTEVRPRVSLHLAHVFLNYISGITDKS